jgi:hypothetical protein
LQPGHHFLAGTLLVSCSFCHNSRRCLYVRRCKDTHYFRQSRYGCCFFYPPEKMRLSESSASLLADCRAWASIPDLWSPARACSLCSQRTRSLSTASQISVCLSMSARHRPSSFIAEAKESQARNYQNVSISSDEKILSAF